MSAPRPSEADVEAPFDLRVAIADPGSILPREEGETVARWSARAVLASDWLAARDAEHEREVAALRGDRDAAVASWHSACGRADLWIARADSAERALADLRGEIEALRLDLNADADYRVTKGSIGHRLRALLPRDDAAGGA